MRRAAPSSITGPTIVPGSDGLPALIGANLGDEFVQERAIDRFVNVDTLHRNTCLARHRRIRLPHSVAPSIPDRHPAPTMTPAFPPNSRTTFFFPLFAFSIHPIAALPVKLRSLKRSSVTMRSATAFEQGTTLRAPGGRSVFENQFAQQQGRQRGLRRGLDHDGIAGRQCRRNLVNDQIQGKIERGDAEHGPIGKRRVTPRYDSMPSVQSKGSTSPGRRFASSAATRRFEWRGRLRVRHRQSVCRLLR